MTSHCHEITKSRTSSAESPSEHALDQYSWRSVLRYTSCTNRLAQSLENIYINRICIAERYLRSTQSLAKSKSVWIQRLKDTRRLVCRTRGTYESCMYMEKKREDLVMIERPLSVVVFGYSLSVECRAELPLLLSGCPACVPINYQVHDIIGSWTATSLCAPTW